jgi:hypothetical protein
MPRAILSVRSGKGVEDDFPVSIAPRTARSCGGAADFETDGIVDEKAAGVWPGGSERGKRFGFTLRHRMALGQYEFACRVRSIAA